jgi:capsular polysaccharide transport system ATP-binding protein
MIQVENVSMHYRTRQGRRTVLDNINLTLERGKNVGILGRNGAGKSTLVQLLAGAIQPTSGRIHRGMKVSWPLAFKGAFQANLTGLDNLKFICRIYNVDHEPLIPFVEDFAELGIYFREPVQHYSSGMTARLAFALSMAIDFDCFLIDEILAVGDKRFHQRCHEELFVKRKGRSFILVSHQANLIRSVCQSACVLHGGHLHHFRSVNEAFRFYEAQPQVTFSSGAGR